MFLASAFNRLGVAEFGRPGLFVSPNLIEPLGPMRRAPSAFVRDRDPGVEEHLYSDGYNLPIQHLPSCSSEHRAFELWPGVSSC
jgi:hypothetical protein